MRRSLFAVAPLLFLAACGGATNPPNPSNGASNLPDTAQGLTSTSTSTAPCSTHEDLAILTVLADGTSDFGEFGGCGAMGDTIEMERKEATSVGAHECVYIAPAASNPSLASATSAKPTQLKNLIAKFGDSCK